MWTANDVCHCDWWAQRRQLCLSLIEGGSHRNHCSTTSHVPTKGFACWNFSVPFHLIWQFQRHVVWQRVLENTAKQKRDDVIDAVRQTAASAPRAVPSSITYVPNRVGPKTSLIPKDKSIDQPHLSIKIIDPVKPTELFSENILKEITNLDVKMKLWRETTFLNIILLSCTCCHAFTLSLDWVGYKAVTLNLAQKGCTRSNSLKRGESTPEPLHTAVECGGRGKKNPLMKSTSSGIGLFTIFCFYSPLFLQRDLLCTRKEN